MNLANFLNPLGFCLLSESYGFSSPLWKAVFQFGSNYYTTLPLILLNTFNPFSRQPSRNHRAVPLWEGVPSSVYFGFKYLQGHLSTWTLFSF